MRNRIRFIAIALASSVASTNQLFLWNLSVAKAKDVPLSASASSKEKPADNFRSKGLLDQVFGGLTKVALVSQFKKLAKNEAPVAISTDRLYETVNTLPGKRPFQPQLLILDGATPEDLAQPLPSGDYILPVQVYCMQKSGASPNAHKYVLGKMAGKRQKIITAFHNAAAGSPYSHNDIQSVSWMIQNGMKLSDMPADAQQIVKELIPDQSERLNKYDTVQIILSAWETGARVLKLPSLEGFLRNDLGTSGQVLLQFLAMRQQIVQSGTDWRNLGRTFVLPNNGSSTPGDIQNTPWSRLQDGVYARFITKGNYDDIGFVEFRVTGAEPDRTGSNVVVPTQNKNIKEPPAQTMPVGKFVDLLGQTAALPEGSDNNQPFGITPFKPKNKIDWAQVADALVNLGQVLPKIVCLVAARYVPVMGPRLSSLCAYITVLRNQGGKPNPDRPEDVKLPTTTASGTNTARGSRTPQEKPPDGGNQETPSNNGRNNNGNNPNSSGNNLSKPNSPSSEKLARNLEQAGIKRPEKTAAHHIVAGSDSRAAIARRILKRFGIDINDAHNGVFLPSTRSSSAPGAYHPELHTNRYYNEINRRLQTAQTREEAIKVLKKIRNDLINNQFPYK